MHPYHVEAYRYLRDYAKPISRRDLADLCEIRAPQPPSRSHIYRLKRDRDRYHDNPRDYPRMGPKGRQALHNMEFLKRQLSMLGGTRTIAPAPEPELYIRPRETWFYVPPERDQELYPSPKPFTFMSPEKALRIARDHVIEIWRLGHAVDMLRILKLWDSFEHFKREAYG